MNLQRAQQKIRHARSILMAQGSAIHRSDGKSTENAHRLRLHARRLMMQRWPTILKPFVAVLSTLFWPFTSYREAKLLDAFSSPIPDAGNLRWKAWWSALKHNLPATEYGAFGLWRHNAAPPDSWLYTAESSILSANLTARSVADLVGDKCRFADFCLQHGTLPVVETLAEFSNGSLVGDLDAETLPQTSLVSKPVRSSMGRGLKIWKPVAGEFRESSGLGDNSLTPHALLLVLQEDSKNHPNGVLLQSALIAHASIEKLSRSGPAVARIITGRWRDGNTEVLDAMLQRPNEHKFKTHGGPFRLIDTHTGKTVPRLREPHIFPTATDDETFDDVSLPQWQHCVSELCSLHDAIDGQAPLLGWDVIFSPGGPTILEANTTLAPYFFQLATQKPASDGKWVSLLSGYLP